MVKTLEHNLTIIKHLDELQQLGTPVLLAHSRKRFLGEITGVGDETGRDLATAVISALSVEKGIQMVRVHDVASTRQAIQLALALQRTS